MIRTALIYGLQMAKTLWVFHFLLLVAMSLASPRTSDVLSRFPAINLPNRTRSAQRGAWNADLWLETGKLGIVRETLA